MESTLGAEITERRCCRDICWRRIASIASSFAKKKIIVDKNEARKIIRNRGAKKLVEGRGNVQDKRRRGDR